MLIKKSVIIYIFIFLLLSVIFAKMSLIVPNDYYGYGVNFPEVETFNTSNTGDSCNPLTPITYLNSISGPFTLLIPNPNQSVLKTFYISGTNYILISTPTGTFRVNSVNSPLMLTYSATSSLWSGNTDSFAYSQKNSQLIYTSGQYNFGVKMLATNTFLFVSAPSYDNGIGAVFIYKYTDLQSGNITPFFQIDGPSIYGSGFGYSLSGNDDYLIVGAPSYKSQGLVNIYQHSSGVWSLIQTINYPDTTIKRTPNFGNSVSLSANNNVLLIGAPNRDFDQGKVYLYTKTAQLSQWTLKQEFAYGGGPSSSFYGYQVATSADGLSVCFSILAPRSVDIYTYDVSTDSWLFDYALDSVNFPAITINYRYGLALAMSNLGDIVAVGAPYDTNLSTGAVFLFRKVAGVWTLDNTFTPSVPETADEFYGFFLALSANGDDILIANPRRKSDLGTVWKYTYNGVWNEISEKTGQKTKYFGYGLAISNDRVYNLVSSLQTQNNGKVFIYAPNTLNNFEFFLSFLNQKISTLNIDNILIPSNPFVILNVNLALSADNSYLCVRYKYTDVIFFKRLSNMYEIVYSMLNEFYLFSQFLTSGGDYLFAIVGNLGIVPVLNIYQKNTTTTFNNLSIATTAYTWDFTSSLALPTSGVIAGNSDNTYRVLVNPNQTTLVAMTDQTILNVYDKINNVWTFRQTIASAFAITGLQLSNDGLTLLFNTVLASVDVYTRANIQTTFALATTIPVPLSSRIAISGSAPYILAVVAGANFRIYSGSGAVWTLLQTITGADLIQVVVVSNNGRNIYTSCPNGPASGTNAEVGYVNNYVSTNLTTWSLLNQIMFAETSTTNDKLNDDFIISINLGGTNTRFGYDMKLAGGVLVATADRSNVGSGSLYIIA